jgi:hypothetical protein
MLGLSRGNFFVLWVLLLSSHKTGDNGGNPLEFFKGLLHTPKATASERYLGRMEMKAKNNEAYSYDALHNHSFYLIYFNKLCRPFALKHVSL